MNNPKTPAILVDEKEQVLQILKGECPHFDWKLASSLWRSTLVDASKTELWICTECWEGRVTFKSS